MNSQRVQRLWENRKQEKEVFAECGDYVSAGTVLGRVLRAECAMNNVCKSCGKWRKKSVGVRILRTKAKQGGRGAATETAADRQFGIRQGGNKAAQSGGILS